MRHLLLSMLLIAPSIALAQTYPSTPPPANYNQAPMGIQNYRNPPPTGAQNYRTNTATSGEENCGTPDEPKACPPLPPPPLASYPPHPPPRGPPPGPASP